MINKLDLEALWFYSLLHRSGHKKIGISSNVLLFVISTTLKDLKLGTFIYHYSQNWVDMIYDITFIHTLLHHNLFIDQCQILVNGLYIGL